jgi:hypothetical protein
LKHPVFLDYNETVSIPAIPLFWYVTLNSNVAFWPQIRSGFMAGKKKRIETFNCSLVLHFSFNFFYSVQMQLFISDWFHDMAWQLRDTVDILVSNVFGNIPQICKKRDVFLKFWSKDHDTCTLL